MLYLNFQVSIQCIPQLATYSSTQTFHIVMVTCYMNEIQRVKKMTEASLLHFAS